MGLLLEWGNSRGLKIPNFYFNVECLCLIFKIISSTAIKIGVRDLLHDLIIELNKNKTAELYLASRDAGDTNYILSVTIPALLGN